MGALSPTHWAIIIILVLLLFGSRKLPDLARGVGQSLRIFKAETTELRDGDKDKDAAKGETPAVEKGGSSAPASDRSEQARPEASGATPSAPGASAGSGSETSADERVGRNH